MFPSYRQRHAALSRFFLLPKLSSLQFTGEYFPSCHFPIFKSSFSVQNLQTSSSTMSITIPLRRQLPRLGQRMLDAKRPLLTSISSKTIVQSQTLHSRQLSTTTRNMSFSNADTGSKPADPYTAKNKEDPESLKEKIGDLVSFVEKEKFCMMTTRMQNGYLASRCMALAAKVSVHFLSPAHST